MLSRPARLAIVTDQDVVFRGLASVLADFGDDVELLGRTGGLSVRFDADVVLYDVARLADGAGADLDRLVKETHATVVAVSRELRRGLADPAITKGVDGLVSLSATAEEICAVVVAAVRGDLPGDTSADAEDCTQNPTALGSSHGLSARESEILDLITSGLSNQETPCRSTSASTPSRPTSARPTARWG